MLRLRIALLAGLALVAAGVLSAQEETPPPPAGTWKVILPTLEQAKGQPVLLLKFTKDKDGKWAGSVLATKLSKAKGEMTKLAVTEKAVKFALKTEELSLSFDVNLSKDAKASKLYGEAAFRRNVLAVEMERSGLTSLDEEFDVVREQLETEPLGMRAVVFARILISDAEEKKVKPGEVRKWAEKAIKSAQLYGNKVLREELTNIARSLAQQKGFETLALQYAQRVENGLDEKAEGPIATKAVLDLLAEVQEKAGKKEDAAKTYARIKKLDFRVKPARYAGRKAKSDRVVLAEVFTSSQAKSCVPTGMAIEALQKTYKPEELVVIAYHQHVREGDPLASPESEERLNSFGKIDRLPVMILNGRLPVPGGGGPEDAQDRYDSYAERIGPLLEADSKAQIKLSATRKGDKITVNTEVGKLEETGDDIRLRVVLVETEVAYRGTSGAAVHYNVARTMPGGVEGTVMKDKTNKKSFTIDLAELKKKLEKYQAGVDKKQPFPKDSKKPLELKKLRVIAYVQNDANNEVWQAAQADVSGE